MDEALQSVLLQAAFGVPRRFRGSYHHQLPTMNTHGSVCTSISPSSSPGHENVPKDRRCKDWCGYIFTMLDGGQARREMQQLADMAADL
jgi:hypothetical protein